MMTTVEENRKVNKSQQKSTKGKTSFFSLVCEKSSKKDI